MPLILVLPFALQVELVELVELVLLELVEVLEPLDLPVLVQLVLPVPLLDWQLVLVQQVLVQVLDLLIYYTFLLEILFYHS